MFHMVISFYLTNFTSANNIFRIIHFKCVQFVGLPGFNSIIITIRLFFSTPILLTTFQVLYRTTHRLRTTGACQVVVMKDLVLHLMKYVHTCVCHLFLDPKYNYDVTELNKIIMIIPQVTH